MLKMGRCQDNLGLCSEAVQHLSDHGKEWLLKTFNEKANSTNISEGEDWHWKHIPVWLIPKMSLDKTIDVSQFRPIHVLTIFHKLYLICLYNLVKNHWSMKGWIQLGARSGHCASEIIHLVRILIEESLEWDRDHFIIALDFRRAFDSLSLQAVVEFCNHEPLPLRLMLALYKQLLGERKVCFQAPGFCTNWVDMEKGLRQGSREASFLFSLS